MNRQKRIITAAVVFGAAGLWMANRLQAFNPQPDPPAFAAMQMLVSETARLYAHCSEEPVHEVPPGPCEVALTFRDLQGATVKGTSLMLRPGQTGFLELRGTEAGRDLSRVEIVPGVNPGRGGRIVPAVQVTDSLTGKTSFYTNPAAPRASFFATE